MTAAPIYLTPSQRSVEEVVCAVASYYRIPRADMIGKSKRYSTVRARHVAIYMCRKLLGRSLNELAKDFGHNDHTSVMYAYEKIRRELADDQRLWTDVVSLERLLAL